MQKESSVLKEKKVKTVPKQPSSTEEYDRRERDVASRTLDLVKREAICAKREDKSLLEARTSAEQLVKVTGLVESYEKKLQALATSDSRKRVNDMHLDS